jgi:hypothetical protein
MTQALIRIDHRGECALFLDGRKSTANVDGVHELPPFREDEVTAEDGSGHLLAAPVVLGCLVEEGGRVPMEVRVEVVQRVFVDGVQVDAGNESIVAESLIEPFTTDLAKAKLAAVAYPARFTKAPYVTIVDRNKIRRASEERRKALITSLVELGGVVQGGSEDRQRQNATRLAEELGRPLEADPTPGTTNAPSRAERRKLLAARIAGLFGLTVAAVTGPAAGVVLLPWAAGMYWRYYTHDDEVEQLKLRGSDVDIPLAAIPSILERAVGYSTGGKWSNSGIIYTFDELRNSGRVADAAVLEMFQYAPPLTAPLPPNDWTAAAKTKLAKAFSAVQTASKELYGNVLNTGGLSVDVLEGRGYVEHSLRIVVVRPEVDAAEPRHGQPLVFNVRASEGASRLAGWLASGAHNDYLKLQSTVASLSSVLQNAAAPLHLSPVVRRKVFTGNFASDAYNWAIGYGNAQLQQERNEFVAQLDDFVDKLRKSAAPYIDALASLKPVGDATASAGLTKYIVRLLPQRAVPSGVIVPTATLRRDAVVDYSSNDVPVSKSEQGIVDAVASCNGSASAVRRALKHWFERDDGVVRQRTRLLLRLESRHQRPQGAVNPPDSGPVVAASRNVYMARFPLHVIDALEGYDDHGRLGERTRIEWLTRGEAARLNIDPTHAGELVASAFVDLACTAILKRQATGPRSELMTSPDAAASIELKLAASLVDAVIDIEASPPWKVPDADAIFACFPGGLALRHVLRESPAWRRWAMQSPVAVGMPVVGGAQLVPRLTDVARSDARTNAYSSASFASHRHMQALVAAMKRGSQRPNKDGHGVDCTRLPFLAGQTLGFARQLAPLRVSFPLDQLNAAYAAVVRVNLLAEALGIGDAMHTTALVDAVWARPIVQAAASATITSDEMRNAVDDILDKTFKLQPPYNDVQLGVPETPQINPTGIDGNALTRLSRRLAALSLDVELLAGETLRDDTSASEGALVQRFSNLDVGAAGTPSRSEKWRYLVPFGAGPAGALHPGLANATAMEQTPIYTSSVLTQLEGFVARAADPVLDSDCRVNCIEIGYERLSPPHPMVIEAEGDPSSAVWPERVAVRVVLNATSNLPRPCLAAAGRLVGASATLRGAVALLQQPAAQCERGLFVDIGAELQWTIERIVQALCIVMTSRPNAVVRVQAPDAPSDSNLTLYADPPQPLPPPRLETTRRRRLEIALLIADYVDKDMDPTTSSSQGEVDLDFELLTGYADQSLEAADTGVIWRSPKPKYTKTRHDAKTDAEVRTALLAASGQAAPSPRTNEDIADAVVDRLKQNARKLQTSEGKSVNAAYEYFKSMIATMEAEHADAIAEWQRQTTATTDLNNAIRDAATQKRDALLARWPALVATAAGLVAELATPPLVVIAEPSSGADALVAKVKASQARRVKAVPLCEWTALLARMT